jgi:hypothetical protein
MAPAGALPKDGPCRCDSLCFAAGCARRSVKLNLLLRRAADKVSDLESVRQQQFSTSVLLRWFGVASDFNKTMGTVFDSFQDTGLFS